MQGIRALSLHFYSLKGSMEVHARLFFKWYKLGVRFDGKSVKVHLVCLRKSAFDAVIELWRIAQPSLHTLVDDPDAADMILFVGDWCGDRAEDVFKSALPAKYPQKCFVYFDADGFVPLLPGIYTNAVRRLIDLRRTDSHMFVDVLNRYTEPGAVGPREKKYLLSFGGGSTSLLRKKLYRLDFGREDILIRNTSDYHHWVPELPNRDEGQRAYAEMIASSHFGLCPRGASSGGLRLFEVMQMGVAPVLVSDTFKLPEGPDWERFLIRVPERRIRELPQIVDRYACESAERGRLAREAWEQWFAPPAMFNNIVARCMRIDRERWMPERWFHPFWRYMLWRKRTRDSMRGVARDAILGVCRVLGLKLKYEMNRS